jgi:cysteine desulfurase family protein (TIGR01976 family)
MFGNFVILYNYLTLKSRELTMTIDVSEIRSSFPALERPVLFLDNPGGTQIVQNAIDRMISYLTNHNANHGGAFDTSRESDDVLEEAHAAVADFLNASRPQEIIFGQNMTSLTFHISRSIGCLLSQGDSILVTRLDHDANITPWTLLAQDRGLKVIWVDFDPETGVLDQQSFEAALEHKPRLAAFGYASNALGTINPVEEMVLKSREVGALVYIDAVQYAPHGPIDVKALGCDFLSVSAYKFFGPHMGILYGRYDLLEELFPYKVRPAPGDPPGKFETGTQNHEGIAGVLGALEYLERLGETFGGSFQIQLSDQYNGRRLKLKQAMTSIQAYEHEISRILLETLKQIPGLKIYGLKDSERLPERVPTYSFNIEGLQPQKVAMELGQKSINVWDGNYYALAVTERLGLEGKGGMVRVGPVHYNTVDEITQLGDALRNITYSN